MFAYGYKLNGIIHITSGFDDWDEAYDLYVVCMEELTEQGVDLSTCDWRGVFDADDIRSFD